MRCPSAVVLAFSLLGCGTPATIPEPPPADRPTDESPPEERPTAALPDERPALPRGPWDEERTLVSAAFPGEGAPSVVVHAPPAFDPARPLRLVVFLHGWTGCARVLAHEGEVACRDGDPPREGWGLTRTFDEAGSDALFVVPQLAFLARDGSPGAFAEPGRFRAFVAELRASLEGRLGPPDPAAEPPPITLLAHSAGFEAALAILARGDVEVQHVVLFDALYRGVEPFVAWAHGGPARRLVSLYTGGARTAAQSRRLAALARRRLGAEAVALDEAAPLGELVGTRRVVVARASASHAAVPARHLPELLGPLGLGAREVHSEP